MISMERRLMTLKRVRVLIALLLISLCVALPVAPITAQTTETLTVYSGRSERLMKPLFDQFSAETGIQLNVRYGSTAEMAATILEEGNNSPADVYLAQDAGALGALTAAGRLRKLPNDILATVPAKFASATGEWVGISGRARVLAYNPDLLTADQLPASILDLTKPEWKGKIGWAPSNGSFQAHVTAMRVLLGEDATRQWLVGMVANETRVYDSNDAIIEQGLATGEIVAGLVNHYYVLEFKAELPTLKAEVHFFPKGDLGSLINVAGAGIVNTNQKPGLAQRLILYLLGKPAQQYFAEKSWEYPLIAGVAVDPSLKPLDQVEAPDIDLNKLSDLQGTLDLLRSTQALP
jgi:iron(III) transport system substrate-binding protein